MIENVIQKAKNVTVAIVCFTIPLIMLGLWIQRAEVMPPNAMLFATKDRTYVSPPCIKFFGLKHFGFNNEDELRNSLRTREDVWGHGYEPNRDCRDKLPAPYWAKYAGGFSGGFRPYLLWKIFGFSHKRWNVDGTWNW